VWLLATVLLVMARPIGAQQEKNVPRIGFLLPGSLATYSPRIDAFRQVCETWVMLKKNTSLSNTVM
jgi:hypothetical protein